MGTQHASIDDRLARWLCDQPVFFVATAPVSGDGLVNCSPKGSRDSFAVLGPRQVAWLDLTGSGVETLAHLRENGRIVLMFCAFAGPPKIVRLHGAGRAVQAGEAGFDGLVAHFPHHPGIRSVVVVDVRRIADSCGFAVPLMDHVADRDLLDRSAARRGEHGLAAYRLEKNAASIDGLPGLRPVP